MLNCHINRKRVENIIYMEWICVTIILLSKLIVFWFYFTLDAPFESLRLTYVHLLFQGFSFPINITIIWSQVLNHHKTTSFLFLQIQIITCSTTLLLTYCFLLQKQIKKKHFTLKSLPWKSTQESFVKQKQWHFHYL